MRSFTASILFSASILISTALSSSKADAAEQAQVVGVWRGHSVCTVKNSPCHDEVNIYHISAIRGKPDEFFVSANKIVDGKEVVMGTGSWKYDEGAHELVYQFDRGTFRLKLDGEKLEGDLKLPDGTLYRLIYLHREK